MVLSEIESAINLSEKIFNWLKSKRTKQNEPIFVERFVQLFEAHGVQRNQIPHFFGHGLQPKDITSSTTLLTVLTNEMMTDACNLFAVRREWLEGTDTQIYPLHDFYKDPAAFSAFLDGLLVKESSLKDLHGVLLIQSEKASNPLKNEALLILEEPIGMLGDRTIFRYHICDNWLFSYWKSRAYLAACIALAWKKGVYIVGRKTEAATITRYVQGKIFLEHNGESALPCRGHHWYPEDMTFLPEVFLDGIDPEKENFGYYSALELWLKLENDGFMDAGLSKDGVREKFESKLIEMRMSKIERLAV